MKNNSCMIKGGTNMNRQDFYDGKLFDAYCYSDDKVVAIRYSKKVE